MIYNPNVLKKPKPKAKAKPKLKESGTCLPGVSGVKRDAPLTFEQNLQQEDRIKRSRTGPPATVSSTAHCSGILTKMDPMISDRFGHLLPKGRRTLISK